MAATLPLSINMDSAFSTLQCQNLLLALHHINSMKVKPTITGNSRTKTHIIHEIHVKFPDSSKWFFDQIDTPAEDAAMTVLHCTCMKQITKKTQTNNNEEKNLWTDSLPEMMATTAVAVVPTDQEQGDFHYFIYVGEEANIASMSSPLQVIRDLQEKIRKEQSLLEELMLTFAMGSHSRLGRTSHLLLLDPHLLHTIWQLLPKGLGALDEDRRLLKAFCDTTSF